MARIKTYTIDALITDNDIVIGSDADNALITKNYNMADLRKYMLSGLAPVTGGTLKITTIDVQDPLITSPEVYFNSQVTPIVVLQYEIIFLILNGTTYIFRKNDDVYGVGETQTVITDFTKISNSVINQTTVLGDGIDVINNNNEYTVKLTENCFSVGTGLYPYKGFNPTSKKHEFKAIKTTGILGFEASNELNFNVVGTNVGGGFGIYKGFDNTQHEFKTLAFGDGILIEDSVDGNSIVISNANPTLHPIMVTQVYAYDAFSDLVFMYGGGQHTNNYRTDKIILVFNQNVVLNDSGYFYYLFDLPGVLPDSIVQKEYTIELSDISVQNGNEIHIVASDILFRCMNLVDLGYNNLRVYIGLGADTVVGYNGYITPNMNHYYYFQN